MLVSGMDNSYTRWIHHGEDLNVDIAEHVPADVHDSDDGIGVLILGKQCLENYRPEQKNKERLKIVRVVIQDLRSKSHF
jgi:hypothetical protein